VCDIILAGLGVSLTGAIEMTVGDRDELHTLRIVQHLAHNAARHETSAYHPDSDRHAGFLQSLELAVYDEHGFYP
jgi:hypothetical protein